MDLSPVEELFSEFTMLNPAYSVVDLLGMVSSYGLLPNDASIALAWGIEGIKRIATFDSDFQRVDFLEVLGV